MLQMLLAIGLVLPHGDLSVRIAEKTKAIKADPSNWVLYMQRGELYAQHEQPDSALMDYQFSIKNGFDSSTVFILMAEAQLALNQIDQGLESVDLFLNLEPDHLKGIQVRAKLYQAQGSFYLSIADFEAVIQRSESPRPQEFMALSELYLLRDSTDFQNAIDVLNRGNEKLGNIISLEMRLYQLEKQRNNFGAAHIVLDRVMQTLSRKERLMVEKADLFLLENKEAEAAEALLSAENSITSLPQRFQNLGATKKLILRIEELKKQL